MVLTYVDVLQRGAPVGPRAAVSGAGGIGFDVAELRAHPRGAAEPDLAGWLREWGIADPEVARGGLVERRPAPPARRIWLLQRKATRPGAGLGRTTGWIHRAALAMTQVELRAGVSYHRIDDRGLTISLGGERGARRLLEVDNVILCTGQEPLRELEAPLRAAGVKVHLVGGADVAAELDAKRAIAQASALAAAL